MGVLCKAHTYGYSIDVNKNMIEKEDWPHLCAGVHTAGMEIFTAPGCFRQQQWAGWGVRTTSVNTTLVSTKP